MPDRKPFIATGRAPVTAMDQGHTGRQVRQRSKVIVNGTRHPLLATRSGPGRAGAANGVLVHCTYTDSAMPPRALLTGTLAVGLVAVPIRLYTATHSEAVAFHLLHDRCGSRIGLRSYCPTCGLMVPREELVRGFEFAKDEYVRFTEDELKAVESHNGRVIDVQEFVPLEAVDPVYFDRTYYLGPGKGGEEGYQLLRRAMTERGRVALATYAMRDKQHLVLVRPVGDGFHLHTLYYADEVANFAEVERPDPQVRPGELELAIRLIEDLGQPDFRPEQYADDYRQRVLAAVEQKRAGGAIEAPEPQAPPPTVDLIATLKKSLEARQSRTQTGSPGAGQRPRGERTRRRAS
jgi:DNA end-binding protein Ku